MNEQWNSFDEFINEFRAKLSTVDELAQVILKGHLEVEMHVDDALGTIFFHPEHLDRLGFAQKVNLVRAYAWNSNNRPDWHVIAKLNTVRNEVAHRGLHLGNRIADLRIALAEATCRSDRQEQIRHVSEKEVVVLAAAICCGFLATLTDDQLKEMRGFIEAAVRDYQASMDGSNG
jgi:hypothetical protein